jgi:hypothetical protein
MIRRDVPMGTVEKAVRRNFAEKNRKQRQFRRESARKRSEATRKKADEERQAAHKVQAEQLKIERLTDDLIAKLAPLVLEQLGKSNYPEAELSRNFAIGIINERPRWIGLQTYTQHAYWQLSPATEKQREVIFRSNGKCYVKAELDWWGSRGVGVTYAKVFSSPRIYMLLRRFAIDTVGVDLNEIKKLEAHLDISHELKSELGITPTLYLPDGAKAHRKASH